MKIARLLVLSLIVLPSAAAVGQSSPIIVVQLSLLNQYRITPTTLFTPTTGGVYRISTYMSRRRGPINTGAWEMGLAWKDGNNAEGADPGYINNTISGSANTTVIRVSAGTPIHYSVHPIAEPTFNYDLYITVEQLESDQ
jgi:hypothetical protein